MADAGEEEVGQQRLLTAVDDEDAEVGEADGDREDATEEREDAGALRGDEEGGEGVERRGQRPRSGGAGQGRVGQGEAVQLKGGGGEGGEGAAEAGELSELVDEREILGDALRTAGSTEECRREGRAGRQGGEEEGRTWPSRLLGRTPSMGEATGAYHSPLLCERASPALGDDGERWTAGCGGVGGDLGRGSGGEEGRGRPT